MDRFEQTLQSYPNFLSKEQFYKVCHISKSTALRLFQSNLIPVIDTKRKTRRYFIAKHDVLTYLREREVNPEKYGIAKPRWSQTYSYHSEFNAALSKRIVNYVSHKWEGEADLLYTNDLHRLLGYQIPTIRKWLSCGWLSFMRIGGVYRIPKCCVIDFVASKTYYTFPRKSTQHTRMIKECLK